MSAGDHIAPLSAAAREAVADADDRAPYEPVGVDADDGSAAPPSGDHEAPETPAEREWVGGFEPYVVGDPGRAAREVIAALPHDPKDPVDTALDGATAGALVARAASSRGTAHRHSGIPRQDDYALCTVDDRWVVVAVADGVSAGPLSHLAATLASRGACALVRDALCSSHDLAAVPWSEILATLAGGIIRLGQERIGGSKPDNGSQPDAARASNVSSSEVAGTMATTLVVAVIAVDPRDDGARTGVVLPLGDTSAFALSADGEWSPITRVKNEGADVATSATVALPYLPANPIEPFAVTLEPGAAIFLMTDGVGDPLGRGDGPVGRFLATEWAEPPDMLSFAGQVAFARRSYDDDRTVVGVWAPR